MGLDGLHGVEERSTVRHLVRSSRLIMQIYDVMGGGTHTGYEEEGEEEEEELSSKLRCPSYTRSCTGIWCDRRGVACLLFTPNIELSYRMSPHQ